MPNLLAMSFEGELTPSFDLRFLRPGRPLPDGWGLGYYPAGEPSASVLKEPGPPRGSMRGELVRAWEHLQSSLFMLHVRTATWGPNTDANTQPFARSWGGRDWTLGHAGSLVRRLDLEADPRFEPVGATDTERIFCALLGRIAARGWRSLAEVDPPTLQGWLLELNALGSLNLTLCDGSHLAAYADRSGEDTLFFAELLPPYGTTVLTDEDVAIDLSSRGGRSCKGVLVSSHALDVDGGAPLAFRRMAPGELLLARQGAVVFRGEPAPLVAGEPTPRAKAVPGGRLHRARVTRTEPARVSIEHRTVYRYTSKVEKSTHVFRLVPMHDRVQSLLSSSVDISVEGATREFDDVFGNRARRVRIDSPYSELSIVARSRVELLDVDPLSFDLRHTGVSIPVVWMPWQRHMLQPFLLPPELPETQLEELIDYAMRFVRRNDGDLLDTLLDLNDSIHRDYRYMPGSTNLQTTAFEVYLHRRGVCQDFANLFICLARLLGVPSRYVCGYLFTGEKHENRRQAEASHAWVQVYLPEVGWRGFDPTNGVVTRTDHVRVAVGRNYVDATPTSGTLFGGGAGETLEVDVRVDRESPA